MGEYTIGLSYIGRRCLFVTRVSGFSRLPVPPARTMPFIFSLSPARTDSTCQGALIIASSDVTRNDVMNRFARLPRLAQLSRQQQGQRVRFTLLRTDRGYADIWRTSASSLLRLLEQCKIRSLAIASVALKTCHFMEQAPPDESPHHLASG